MAIKMVREPSDTPNINNVDDIIPIRYAYNYQDGYVVGKGQEISYSINGTNFIINSGRLVLQGVECDVDANGVTISVDNIATMRGYIVYLQVNLATNEVSINSEYNIGQYPTFDEGDDLTENSSGTARMLLYRFTVTNGIIDNIDKFVLPIKNQIIYTTKSSGGLDANIGIGYNVYNALDKDSGSGNNIAIGESALSDLISGSNNIAIGLQAATSLQYGRCNIAIGYNSALNLSNGEYNTFIGLNSGTNVGSHNRNVGIGIDTLRTCGDNNTAIGVDALENIGEFNNCSGVGYNSNVTSSNQVQLGDSNTTTYVYGSVQNRSDKRDKADIQDIDLGLDFIKKLRPRKFKWDYRENYGIIDKDGSIYIEDEKQNKILVKKDGSKCGKRFHNGLIAQEVKEVIDEMGIDFAGYQDHKICGGKDVLSLGYNEFIAPIIKAIQEQQVIIEELKEQVRELQNSNL